MPVRSVPGLFAPKTKFPKLHATRRRRRGCSIGWRTCGWAPRTTVAPASKATAASERGPARDIEVPTAACRLHSVLVGIGEGVSEGEAPVVEGVVVRERDDIDSRVACHCL